MAARFKFDCIIPEARGTTMPTPLVVGRMIVNVPDLDLMHVVEFDRERTVWPLPESFGRKMNTFSTRSINSANETGFSTALRVSNPAIARPLRAPRSLR